MHPLKSSHKQIQAATSTWEQSLYTILIYVGSRSTSWGLIEYTDIENKLDLVRGVHDIL